MTKEVLGHIDCPTCAAVKGMRITLDKNKHPFGFCEAQCGQQLRIGGDLRRVAAFVARFPWAGIPVTGTVTAPTTPEPAQAAPAPAPKPVPLPEPKPAVKAPAPKPAATKAPVVAPPKQAWFSTLLGPQNG